MDIEIPKTFLEVVKLLGSPLLIGIVLSLMLKEWVWFTGLKPWMKWTLTLLVSVLMPLLSRIIETYLPLNVMAFLESWWPTVAAGIAVWVASQVWNQIYNKKVDRQYSVFEVKAK